MEPPFAARGLGGMTGWMKEKTEIAVIGAGIVGLATALHLAARGKEVVMLDPRDPGTATSFGNAACLAPYACVPVGTPEVLSSLPSLLFGRDSFFSLRWRSLPGLAPWLLRFARECSGARSMANARALAALLPNAIPAWDELAAEAGAGHLIKAKGALYAYHRLKPAPNDLAMQLRGTYAKPFEFLDQEQLAQMEPQLAQLAGGLFFPTAKHIDDPITMSNALAAAATKRGAEFVKAKVEKLHPDPNGATLSGQGFSLRARHVVLCGGAWSKELAKQAGINIPLETERGYHLEFATPEPLISRPVCPVDFGFYFTPFEGRLRAVGTVEMAGLAPPPNPKRWDYIERRSRELFPTLGPVQSRWMGYRPSVPDSRPVIGRAAKDSPVIFAFGHGHLGMTFAAVTGRMVANTIMGNAMSPEHMAFSPQRFA